MLSKGIVIFIHALRSMPIKLTYLRKNVKEFTGFLDPLIEDAENLQPAELINLLRVTLDYDRYHYG